MEILSCFGLCSLYHDVCVTVDRALYMISNFNLLITVVVFLNVHLCLFPFYLRILEASNREIVMRNLEQMRPVFNWATATVTEVNEEKWVVVFYSYAIIIIFLWLHYESEYVILPFATKQKQNYEFSKTLLCCAVCSMEAVGKWR